MKEERILKIKPPLPKDGEFVKHEYVNIEGLPFKPKYDVEGYQGLHWYLIKETERGKLFFRTLEEAGRDAAFRLYIERMKNGQTENRCRASWFRDDLDSVFLRPASGKRTGGERLSLRRLGSLSDGAQVGRGVR